MSNGHEELDTVLIVFHADVSMWMLLFVFVYDNVLVIFKIALML